MTKNNCKGCRDDFYNSSNSTTGECWMFTNAKLEPRVLIHINDAPPYLNQRVQMLPNCYKKAQYVSVTPDRIGEDGYWK